MVYGGVDIQDHTITIAPKAYLMGNLTILVTERCTLATAKTLLHPETISNKETAPGLDPLIAK